MQLYARVFVQILDSSIAEDFTTRHIFEDFFKLVAPHSPGVVDMTRQAISRRLFIPLDILNQHIAKLEAPDPNSRDQEFEGRRLERLDDHRDWGWKILNWEKYEALKNKADVAARVARHRAKPKTPDLPFKPEVSAELIYEAYPRKVGRPDALKAITKALVKIDAAKLLSLTESYATASGGTEMRYIPHPSTWFNQERYNDDPATWVKGVEKGSGADKVLKHHELQRVEARLKHLNDSYDGNTTWAPKDREEKQKLRDRQKVLVKELGMMV